MIFGLFAGSKNNISENNKKSHQRYNYTLIGIISAILLGSVIGGWFPQIAVKFTILGEVFMNLLMMIVVPLVILSMIDGVTKLGDTKNLGSLGVKTLIYFLLTTGIAVIIGISLVNIIQPGKNLSAGEKHPDFEYQLVGKYNRTIYLVNNKWNRTLYNKKFVIKLLDQNVQGQIESFDGKSVKVKLWESLKFEEQYYLNATDGTLIQFSRVEGQLISQEPKLNHSGKGVEINLPMNRLVRDQENNIEKTLKELLIGNKDSGKQGLIPFNIFAAMYHMDVLSLIFFSLLFGAALAALGSAATPVISIISSLDDGLMKVVHWIMLFAPFGIFGLIAGRIGIAGGFKNFIPELISLGKYFGTVILGLAIHALIVLPLILRLRTKYLVFPFAKGVFPALLNAFSTASSSATIPLTFKGLKEQNKVSDKIVNFVVTLGATINMNGTALYEAVASIFIAQVYGIELSPAMQIVIFLTSTLAAIGAAAIPEAGLVTMVIVLKAAGLPLEGVGLILSIDWLLDRFRTAVNTWDDCVSAAVIEDLDIRQLKRLQKKQKLSGIE